MFCIKPFNKDNDIISSYRKDWEIDIENIAKENNLIQPLRPKQLITAINLLKKLTNISLIVLSVEVVPRFTLYPTFSPPFKLKIYFYPLCRIDYSIRLVREYK